MVVSRIWEDFLWGFGFSRIVCTTIGTMALHRTRRFIGESKEVF